MLLIGLTGGIASGKSLVASLFKKKKIPVIDADQIARAVVRPGQKAYQGIVAAFGSGVLKKDRTIDRAKLGELVFSDEKRRRLLETITHPEIRTLILQEISAWRKKKFSMIVIDAALLFESGLYRQMDKIILVKAEPNVQLQRLMKRDKVPEAEAWNRILAQMPSPEKERCADFVIDNSGSRAATQRQFLKIVPAVVPGRHRRRKASGRG